MPDPTRATLSATQTPALFGVSPYLTRWMLLRHFIHGDPIDTIGDNRMNWGLRMQPLLLQQAAEDQHLEVRPDETYKRLGLLGCTRDAEIICPDRGPGALECKCVFDYGVWMRDWDGGKSVPRHYEIQLQQQMLVGSGDDGERYQWGIIAAWVCGEIHYFERKPIFDLWESLNDEALKFFKDVEAKREGEPFGEQVELPLISRLFAPQPGVKVDLTTRDDANDLVSYAQLLRYHATERSAHDKEEKKYKARLKAVMGDAEEGVLPYGVKITAKQTSRAGYTVKPTTYTTIDVFLPGSTPPVQPKAEADNILAGG